MVRVASFNVSGQKGKGLVDFLSQQRPVEGIEGLMRKLGADILCIQEHQLTQDDLNKNEDLENLPHTDTFYSLDRRKPRSPKEPLKNNYGAAIFTKRKSCVPIKVEEGLSDRFVRDVVKKRGQIGGYPTKAQTGLDQKRMAKLDNEGRAVVVDVGLFVLINVYAPNEPKASKATTREKQEGRKQRIPFKADYDTLLEHRIRNLIAAGREVILCGDLNIPATELDVSDQARRNHFKDFECAFDEWPPRRWLRELFKDGGLLVDAWRKRNPGRQGMTYFETARVDYFLVTPGLLPWIKDCSIDPSRYGSDHHPIYLDLHESLTFPEHGRTRSLWDEMNPGRKQGDPLPEAPKMQKEKRISDALFGRPISSLPRVEPDFFPTAFSPASTSRTLPTASTSTSASTDPFTTSRGLVKQDAPSSGSKKGKEKEHKEVTEQPKSVEGGEQRLHSSLFKTNEKQDASTSGDEKGKKKRSSDGTVPDHKKRKKPSSYLSPSAPASPSTSFSPTASPSSVLSRPNALSACKPSRTSAAASTSASHDPTSRPEVLVLPDSDDDDDVLVLDG
ncbi:hypothetical protein JCM6882_004094 [Rhodosporidiobolus microsporus]